MPCRCQWRVGHRLLEVLRYWRYSINTYFTTAIIILKSLAVWEEERMFVVATTGGVV